MASSFFAPVMALLIQITTFGTAAGVQAAPIAKAASVSLTRSTECLALLQLTASVQPHRATDSQSRRQMEKCARSFEKCWSRRGWRSGPRLKCERTKAECTRTLCGPWYEAKCETDRGLCSKVRKMCGPSWTVHKQATGGPSRTVHKQATGGPSRKVHRQEIALMSTASHSSSDAYFTETSHSSSDAYFTETNLEFLHIPKCAGTSIESAAMDGQRIRWGRQRMFYYGMMAMPDATFYCAVHHVPPKYLPTEIADIYRNRDVFCIVRDPYQRALSEYKYLLSVPWGMNKPGLFDEEPCTPEGLNQFLRTSLRFLTDGKRFVNDCHMVPQSDFVYDGEKQWCQDVLKFEELPDAFNEFMERKNVSVRLKEPENQSKDTCPNLHVDMLSDDVLDSINQVYGDDFRRLGYQMRQAR